MKLILKRFDPASRLGRYVFHADPDELLAASEQFARILRDTRVGGVWKRSGSARLTNTLTVIGDYLARTRRTSVNVLDAGASDGTTTIELVECLRGAFRVRAWLADKYLRLDRFSRFPFVEYRASDGSPSLVRLGRLGLRLPRSEHSWHLPANLLAAWYMKLERFRASMPLTGVISLVNPRVAEYPQIQVLELDCLQRREALVGAMDVIRLSNLLNCEYFDDHQIREVVRHMHAYLRDDGCLLISRNVDRGKSEIECGALWRKTPTGLSLEAEFGGGSDVSAIVAEFRAQSS